MVSRASRKPRNLRRGLAAFVIALSGCRSATTASSQPAGPASTAAPWLEERATVNGLVFNHASGHRDKYLFPEIVCGGAALFDMDQDGDLDAYCIQAGGVLEDPARRPPNRLFRNLGDGRFEDATEGSGADDRGYGMGVATGDYDKDGDTDLFVTNLGINALLRNEGAGHFTNVTNSAGVGNGRWGSSAAFLDIDADGDLDLFVVNYIRWSVESERDCSAVSGKKDYCDPVVYQAPLPAVLFCNNGDGTFTNISESSGVASARGNGLGVVAGDFNNDGRIDIYVANDGTPNHLWLNQGNGKFREDARMFGCAVDQDGIAKAGMGVCAEDLDDDGDEDLLAVNLSNESDSFYRNQRDYFVDHTARVGLGTATKPFTRFGAGLLDFNNDGFLDLYEANGRVRRQSLSHSADPFAEPNVLLSGGADGRFREVQPRGGVAHPLIATSRAAVFGDVNNDGGMDVLVINRDGPAHLLMNVVRDRGHWIMFRVLDRHGRDAIGAVVSLRVLDRRITRRVRTAYSYCAANDPRVHIGVGRASKVEDVTVVWVDGQTQSFGDFPADQIATLQASRSIKQ